MLTKAARRAAEQRMLARWYALECARESARALVSLVDDVGALAAERWHDIARLGARWCDDSAAALSAIMRDGALRADRGELFAEGKAWRRAHAPP